LEHSVPFSGGDIPDLYRTRRTAREGISTKRTVGDFWQEKTPVAFTGNTPGKVLTPFVGKRMNNAVNFVKQK
jgi:hypothetical protein